MSDGTGLVREPPGGCRPSWCKSAVACHDLPAEEGGRHRPWPAFAPEPTDRAGVGQQQVARMWVRPLPACPPERRCTCSSHGGVDQDAPGRAVSRSPAAGRWGPESLFGQGERGVRGEGGVEPLARGCSAGGVASSLVAGCGTPGHGKSGAPRRLLGVAQASGRPQGVHRARHGAQGRLRGCSFSGRRASTAGWPSRRRRIEPPARRWRCRHPRCPGTGRSCGSSARTSRRGRTSW